jgi:hypothetical protein
MVESLVAQGARFDICLNTVDTLERESGKRPEFIAAATPVQVGVAQILFLTENGYTLVRLSCERSEAIHLSQRCGMDCFASLAMTGAGLKSETPSIMSVPVDESCLRRPPN